VRHLGVSVFVDPALISRRRRAEILFGLYERGEASLVREHLRGASNVVELGPGAGIVTRHVIDVMKPGGRLLCVEANPRMAAALPAALKGPALAKNIEVEVLNFAIADNQHVAFRTGADFPSNKIVDPSDPEAISVEGLSLAEILGRAAVPRPFALVADIEGAEANFIADAGHGSALDACERMVIELHDTTVGDRPLPRDELIRSLEDTWGFHCLGERGRAAAFAR
jgi:FkbM family methyltransferase